MTPPPVAERARALGLDVDQPDDVNDAAARARLAAAEPEAVCVCAYGGILREPLLSEQRPLNVHPSLLPRWRGAAPIERAIMAGDEESGVSIMRVQAELDSGPVCLSAAALILAGDTYGSLAGRLATLGGELLVRALEDGPAFVEQDPALVTYAEKISARDRFLDPGRPATELERQVRALHPHVGARVAAGRSEVLGVHAARVHSEAHVSPGELRVDEAGRLLLGCAPGALELVVVQSPGSRAMGAPEYLRGHGVPPGPVHSPAPAPRRQPRQ